MAKKSANKKTDGTKPLDNFRQRAEERLKANQSKKKVTLSDIETYKLIHELEVHQIELEMQQEELTLAKELAEAASAKYTQLYDFAPSGYLTLSGIGEILSLNFATAKLLGNNRGNLINKYFSTFLSYHSKHILGSFLDALFQLQVTQTAEVELVLKDKPPVYLLLTGIAEDSNSFCNITLTDITERKKAEDKMRLTERLLLATQSAHLGIWDWDIKNNVLTWDEGMYRLYNIAANEFTSVFEGWFSSVHPEDKEQLQIELELALANIKDYQPEFRIVWGDSSIRYINASAIIERDNDGNAIRMIGTNWDITAKKEKERHLKLLESVITNTMDSVMITEAEPFDEPGPRILYVNDAFTKMTGYSAEEVIGKTPRILQGPKSDKAELKRLSETIRRWEACEITTINYKKNREEFWINFTLTAVANEKGWYTHWIAIERDVTEQKLVEIKLNELNENLKNYAKNLALSNTELEQFAYVASHDLQEPLRMITSFLTQLEKKYGDVIDDKGKKYIGFAVDGAKRMRQIILDLLEYSRVGRIEEKREELDLNELINEIKILLRKTIEEKEAVLIIDPLPKIHAYKSAMRQVFQNLINNALKYSNKEIPVQINITVKELERHWQFAVIDNGIGIKKENLEKIFIIFQRLHTREAYPGTGLGLAIVKKIIEAPGGKIWVESKEDKGSTFYFTIKK